MATPTLTPHEARTHHTFTALMWVLSYPGRVHTLPDAGMAAFIAIGEALVDLETSYFTPDVVLSQQLAHTGARAGSTSTAMYQFYPALRAADLDALEAAPVGTALAPDEAATFVIGCMLGTGVRLRLHGPGIDGASELLVDGIPQAFWSLREQACRYPLGWDVFLVAHDQVVGLPRTTKLEVC
jgi:alpha-D-ribose 1-methylphosphonate 5-triphosphate synthase subunit PhnH